MPNITFLRRWKLANTVNCWHVFYFLINKKVPNWIVKYCYFLIRMVCLGRGEPLLLFRQGRGMPKKGVTENARMSALAAWLWTLIAGQQNATLMKKKHKPCAQSIFIFEIDQTKSHAFYHWDDPPRPYASAPTHFIITNLTDSETFFLLERGHTGLCSEITPIKFLSPTLPYPCDDKVDEIRTWSVEPPKKLQKAGQ